VIVSVRELILNSMSSFLADDPLADLEHALAIDRHGVVDEEEVARPELHELLQLGDDGLGRTSAELRLADVAERARRGAAARALDGRRVSLPREDAVVFVEVDEVVSRRGERLERKRPHP